MNEALASWVPPSVLVGVALSAAIFLWNKLDKLLEKIVTRLESIESKLHGYATVEQLGRLGDRIDGRVTNISERVKVLEVLGRRREDESDD